ncbi:MAG: hypothetical protein IJR70_08480 [Eubacterium sp.]|nr:hypothetical protein [Eubacterium sp.]
MKRNNRIIKSALLTLASLIIGFIAIAVPFNLFNTLTSEAMHIVFIAEIIIYFLVSMFFLIAYDKKKQEKIKLENRHKERLQKIECVKRDWIDIAA